MNPKRLIFLIVALHVVLAAGYARVTPYRTAGVVRMQGGKPVADVGAPDERQHVNYVAHLLSGRGLPVFDPRDPHLYESYQSHQPPLYYLVAAGYCKLLGLADPTEPHAGFALRLLNAAIGAWGVLGVWFLAVWSLRDGVIAAAAATIAAFLPMNLALSGAVSNDPLLICLCTWCLAFCCKGVYEGWSLRSTASVGLLMGLAFLTKTTAIALLPVVALSFFLRRPQPIDSALGSKPRVPRAHSPLFGWDAPTLRRAATAVGIAAVLALPWWIRNQAMYGDPLAIKAFNQAFVGSMQASTAIHRLGGAWSYWVSAVGFGTMCSFFGVFGYWDVWLDVSTYYVLAACSAVLIVGWFFSLGGRRAERPAHLLCGIFFLLVVASFMRFNMQYFQAQGRYLLPALGPIALALASGLAMIARRGAFVVTLCLAAALLGLNVFILRMLPVEFADRTAAAAGIER